MEKTIEPIDRIAKCGIIPVIVIDDPAQACPTAQALLSGGINIMEITFRTSAAAQSITIISARFPEMLIGAGTILSNEQLDQAILAGAQFIVSPGLDAELVKAAIDCQVPILPGAVTPSEIMAGLKLGIRTFKFFPAENYGGLASIMALCEPFPSIKFVPTGGISEKNLQSYMENDKITAVGGSWMATQSMIRAGQFDEITRKSRQAVDFVKTIRS